MAPSFTMQFITKETDPWNGVTTEYWAKPDGNVYIRRTVDAENVIRKNKQMQNEHNGRYGNIAVVGSIPILILEQWQKETGVNMFSKEFDTIIKRKLNDPDYKYLKTVNGTV